MKNMKKGTFGYNFVEPLILKILRESNVPMASLAINYMVNQSFGREVNSRIIKKHLAFLVDVEKISKDLDKLNNVTYYKPIV